jgi:hypothetical protein
MICSIVARIAVAVVSDPARLVELVTCHIGYDEKSEFLTIHGSKNLRFSLTLVEPVSNKSSQHVVPYDLFGAVPIAHNLLRYSISRSV